MSLGLGIPLALPRQTRVPVSKKYSNLDSRDYIGCCGPFASEEPCDEMEMCIGDVWGADHFAPLPDHTPKRLQFLEPEFRLAARSSITFVVGYQARFDHAAGARHL